MSDDFEFRPLTEGLGFHKKVIDLKEKEKEKDDSAFAASFHPHPAVTPAPRPSAPAAQKKAPASAWEPALPKASLDEAAPVSRPTQLVPVAAGWPAALFDTTMVLGLSLLFTAVIFAVTKIDLATLLQMIQSDGASQLAAAVLVVSVFEIYSVSCRTFFGKTLGEWAFEYRLGSYAQQEQIAYPLKVAWRSLLTAVTGFIFLPVLSTILKRDVAGILSGAPIFMEKR